jgi:hypothetical protein
MRDMDRALLLGALGWPEKSNIEGAARWSKASDDMLTSVSYRVSQDESMVKASLDLEGCDENYEAVRRPLLAAEFKVNARGRLQLTSYIKNGSEQPIGEHSQPEVLESFAQAKISFSGKPKLALLGGFGPEPGALPGAKL